MQKLLSTYLFVSRKLTRELLSDIAAAGFQGVEIFCSRAHFNYTSKAEAQDMKQVLQDCKLTLTSLHAPTSRDLSATRESGQPLSICEVERVRRIEAMDELKRADPRKRDAAFSSLEHLILHARHVGVTICVENTTSEMGDPAYLRAFVDETRLTGLRFNFDIGHAHLADGPAEERIQKSFEPLRDLVASMHIHDNRGEKDEHLPPYDGTIDWEAAIKTLQSAPDASTPMLLELKEKAGPEAPTAQEQLKAGAKSLDRFEREWG
jgi:sugar phosphate isomerase/epimerase